MVRKTTLKTTILSSFTSSFVIASIIVGGNLAYADCTINNGATSCDDNANFQVTVPGVLTVQITRPNSWAVGDTGALLRNIITLDVASNSPAGFTASMTSDSTTTAGAALSNVYNGSSSTIPMLTSDWTRSNTSVTKFWGYSLDDVNETGTYSALALKDAANPTTLIPSGTLNSASKNIYFGAKADSSVDSGTYQGTVIISVVSGAISQDNPVIPVDPATPDDTTTNNPVYESGTPGRTIYTARTYEADTNTSTLEVSEGDTRSSYQSPQGVSTAQINEGTPLATGLAVTAAAAATAGIIFFIVGRRRDDDEEEDEY